MSFQDFTSINMVAKKYDLILSREKLFDYTQIPAIQPPEALRRILEFELAHQPRSAIEYALCESLIYPLIRETWMHYPGLQVWSHVSIQVDEDLTGIPDYLVAKKSPQGLEEVEMPLLVVFEAKREDFVAGWGQCLAGMVAAQKLNANLVPAPTIYGIVTTGLVWEFGLLAGNQFKAHLFNLSLTQTELLLALLSHIFAQCEAQLTKIASI